MRIRFLLIFVPVVCAGCASAPAPRPAASAKPVPALADQLRALKGRLLALVSEERRRLAPSAGPLALDAELVVAAQRHADAMARGRSFDPSGTGDNAAIATLLDDPRFSGYVGENVAAQYFTASVGMDSNSFARGFLDLWLNSAGHKANLTDARFARTGIGVAIGGDEVFVAELFADEPRSRGDQP